MGGKLNNSIAGQFAARKIDMLKSPAYESLAFQRIASSLASRSNTRATAGRTTASSPSRSTTLKPTACVATASGRQSTNWRRLVSSKSRITARGRSGPSIRSRRSSASHIVTWTGARRRNARVATVQDDRRCRRRRQSCPRAPREGQGRPVEKPQSRQCRNGTDSSAETAPQEQGCQCRNVTTGQWPKRHYYLYLGAEGCSRSVRWRRCGCGLMIPLGPFTFTPKGLQIFKTSPRAWRQCHVAKTGKPASAP